MMLDDLAAAGASAAVSAVVATLLSSAGLAQETRDRTARPRPKPKPLERWWRRMAALPFCGARDCPPVPETAVPGKSFEDFLGGLFCRPGVHFGWKAVTRDGRPPQPLYASQLSD